MSKSYPCGGSHRREFLAGAAAAFGLAGLAAHRASAMAPLRLDDDLPPIAGKSAPLGVPGPYRGQVVEVRHPGLIRDGVRSREAVGSTLKRGLAELTGKDDAVEAWKTFVQPGEVIGIKVVPNGFPMAPTSIELILEVIAGLESAGIARKDILVFDRYASEFLAAGIDKALPDGVRWGALTPKQGDPSQLTLKFEGEPLSGYDPDEFVEMNLIHYGNDPADDRNLRSHLGMIVTRRVDKIIGLPCLKDHGSAGVTGALKNMSHGLVNNVARSHSTPQTNACNQFIPEVVAHPVIRRKCVLQIMDGSRGVWQGGPFGSNPKFAWEYNALLFATDPVAMDHVAWDIIDAKRKAMGVPGVAAVGKTAADPFGSEGFDVRQPQHIPLAANLGLGVFDLKSPRGRRNSLQHRVVDMKA